MAMCGLIRVTSVHARACCLHPQQSSSTHGTPNKAHHQFLRRDFTIKKMSNKIVFKSSVAKILIIVLFLKIILIMYFADFFIPQFSLASLQTYPKLPRHTS
jgi:hypothetical protein